MILTKDNLSVLLPELNPIQLQAIRQAFARERQHELELFYGNLTVSSDRVDAYFDARNAELIKEFENHGGN